VQAACGRCGRAGRCGTRRRVDGQQLGDDCLLVEAAKPSVEQTEENLDPQVVGRGGGTGTLRGGCQRVDAGASGRGLLGREVLARDRRRPPRR
jgi:hypothetical protein